MFWFVFFVGFVIAVVLLVIWGACIASARADETLAADDDLPPVLRRPADE